MKPSLAGLWAKVLPVGFLSLSLCLAVPPETFQATEPNFEEIRSRQTRTTESFTESSINFWAVASQREDKEDKEEPTLCGG